MNIVFTCDNNYAIYLNVAIASMLKNSDKNDNFKFFILHPDFTEKTMNDIKNLKKIKDFDVEFIKIDLDKELDECFINETKIKKICYLRLKIPNILYNLGYKLDRVLFIDADIIVYSSLNELYNTDIGDYEIAACASPILDEEREHIPTLNLNKNHKYLHAALLIMNCKKLLENNFYEKCCSIYKEKKDKLYWADMDILNLLFDNNNYYVLDPKYSINPLFEPYKQELNFYKEIYKDIYSEEKIEEAFYRPVIHQMAGGAKPTNSACFLKTIEVFYEYAKLTTFKEEAKKFILEKEKVLEKKIKKIKGVRKLWYMFRDIIGCSSKKYNKNNNYTKIRE